MSKRSPFQTKSVKQHQTHQTKIKMNTFVCISSYYKGYDLWTSAKTRHQSHSHHFGKFKRKNWPWHAIDEVYYMPETEPFTWNLDHLVQRFSIFNEK